VQIDLLIRKQNDTSPYTITCDLAERVVFGRAITSPIPFEGTEISREHFAVFSKQGVVYMEDLSSNGTRVNGAAVSTSKPRKLAAGDIISIPGYEIELDKRLLPADPGPVPLSPSTFSRPTISAPFLTAWEIVIVAAAIASFTLIIYYSVR